MTEFDGNNIAEQEQEAIESYINNVYAMKVPEPQTPTKEEMSFFKIAGIEAILFTLSSFGVIIFSSIRTGGLFYVLEILLLKKFSIDGFMQQSFSLTSMIASLIAFEGYTAAYGFAKGKDSKALKPSRWGLFSSLLVIVSGGIFAGMGLVELPQNIVTGIYIAIALITALAGGAVAYFSGESAGFTFSKVQSRRENLLDTHQRRYQEWRFAGVKAYQSSHYALGSRKNSEFVQRMNTPLEHSQESSSNNPKNEQSNNETFNVHKNPSKLELVYISIEQFVNKFNKMPTTDEVVQSGASRAYASLAMNRFIVNNYPLLIQNNVINQERANKALAYMDRINKESSQEEQPQQTQEQNSQVGNTPDDSGW